MQNQVSFKKHVHVRMACLLEVFDAQKCLKKAIFFLIVFFFAYCLIFFTIYFPISILNTTTTTIKSLPINIHWNSNNNNTAAAKKISSKKSYFTFFLQKQSHVCLVAASVLLPGMCILSKYLITYTHTYTHVIYP